MWWFLSEMDSIGASATSLHTVGGSTFLAVCIWRVHHDGFMMGTVLVVYTTQYAYVDVLSKNGVDYCSSSELAIHSNYTCIAASNKLFTPQGTLAHMQTNFNSSSCKSSRITAAADLLKRN